MKVKTKVAYVATIGEFYSLHGRWIDGIIANQNPQAYVEIQQMAITTFPEIDGPFRASPLFVEIYKRLKEKF